MLRATSPHAPVVVSPTECSRSRISRQRFDGHPVQLHILPDSNVRHAARVLLRDIGDRAQLLTTQNSVGDPDTDHEKGRGLPFTVHAADHALPITLRVNAP